MLQAYVSNILSVFSDVRCKCFYLDVAYVSRICCKCLLSRGCVCFAMAFQVLLQVFRMYVQVFNACYKHFIWMFHKMIECYTCCNVAHLQQPFAAATGAPCIRVGSQAMEHYAATGMGSGGKSVGSGVGGPCLTQACSRHGPPTHV
jgi:hypothetical protein